MALYDSIGSGYARTRREDPRIARAVASSIGNARSLVNVGAGSGSYEPPDRQVIAIELSEVMIAQRPPHRARAVCASAGMLPLRDTSLDAAMSVLSVHHWGDQQADGLREMRRVARGPVVIVTYDATVSAEMWLMRQYLPEVAELDLRTFPTIGQIRTLLGGDVSVVPLPIHRDSPDWSLGSFWAHPERVLDEEARNATSGFARQTPAVIARVLNDLSRDLASGAWDAEHGHLRRLPELDVGLRLVVSTPAGR